MSIVFLAPDAEMATVAEKVQSDFPEKILVVQGLLNEALSIARKLEEKGMEVLVARGGTAWLLRKEGIKTPLVELALTSRDVAEAVTEAKDVSGFSHPRIGVVAFPNMIQNLLDFLPFLKPDLRCYKLTSQEAAREAVEEAIRDGAQVLLGGVITTILARERGLPAVLLRSRESALYQAFEEARRIAYARRLEGRRSNQIKAIVEYAYEGIVAVDREGKVTVFNPVAQQLTDIRQEEAIGQAQAAVVPSLALMETLASGLEDVGQVVDLGRTKVIVSRVPIRVNGEIEGAVATFQDVTRIQSMEQRIRQEIHSKGHVAKFTFRDIRCESRSLAAALTTAERYARSDSTVMIRGETGTGKELFAQGIHNASPRRQGPFVAVNCAALPESLLESELFGYVEGAFTGARRKGKAGLFEQAHRGTIFLDEVSEIPLSLQGRLLRVLQEREVIRLGHDRVIPIDVRVLCATNRDLHRLVGEGRFRDDLYWRLNVLSISIPPLRERPEEIVPLIKHFLGCRSGQAAGQVELTGEAASFLVAYPWPGNVRELRNFCERLSVAHRKGAVGAAAVRELHEYQGETAARDAYPASTPVPTEIEEALAQAHGSMAEAARRLGIHRTTLWRRLKSTR
jgi:PAS domain S-box-containing protein